MGASQFSDAVTDDSRLVMRPAEAIHDGAQAINYLKAETLITNEQGSVVGATLKDTSSRTMLKTMFKAMLKVTMFTQKCGQCHRRLGGYLKDMPVSKPNKASISKSVRHAWQSFGREQRAFADRASLYLSAS